MSLSGSLMTYDNNNDDLMNSSHERMIKKSSTVVTQAPGQKQPLVAAVSTQTHSRYGSGSRGGRKTGCCRSGHLNSLWSLWYGLLATAAQMYVIMQATRRFLGYWMLEWRGPGGVGVLDTPVEVYVGLASIGVAAALAAPFLAAAVFKSGNLANDGQKLGVNLSTCSAGPRMPPPHKKQGILRSLWQHGGPTAPFLHLVMAFCLLLPKVMMEARLMDGGFLPQETVWRTDLDFLVMSKDRLVISSFMSSSSSNSNGHISNGNNINNNHSTSSTTTGSTTSSASQMFTTLPSVYQTTVPETTAFQTTTPKPKSKMSKATEARRNSVTRTMPRMATTTARPSAMNGTRKSWDNSTGLRPEKLTFSVERTLIDIFGVEPWDPNDLNGWNGPVSLEFMNYAVALLVYAVRYPAVFWSTNKCFGLIFSMQLLANGVQSLISFAGMSVLYKVQMMGAEKALPLLRHRNELNLLGGTSPFLLNPMVTVALYVLSQVLVFSSSLVLYLYGYGRYHAFLNSEREKRIIMIREGRTATGWGYFTHCAALCVLLAIAVCCAPLLHDYTVVYRGSLDGASLACVISIISHLFLWVLAWLFLTLKQRWTFKIRVTIGRATVRSARSVKLLTDVDLMSSRGDEEAHSQQQPLLVVGNGRTYTVADTSPKKAIMTVIQRAACEKKAKDDDGEDQIYWLRPKTMSLNASGSSDKLAWFNKKMSGGSAVAVAGGGKPPQKVTFNDVPCTSNALQRNKERGASLRIGEGDDGDYATLKELPIAGTAMLDTGDDTSEEGKLLACVRDDRVTYACTKRDLVPPCDYDNTSPLLTPEPLPDPPTESNSQLSPVTTSSAVTVHTSECQSNSGLTPRCLRRADSGVPGEETVRSGSGSSGSSPPDPPGSSTSDSSSGVHSAASMPAQRPRANSFDDFMVDHQPKEEAKLKSFSLQRGVLPPTAVSSFAMDINQSVYGYSGIKYTSVLQPQLNGHVATESNIPPTIVEDSVDNTVIIRRQPFGRSTNMKMTTFANHMNNMKEQLSGVVASSATLPHYPTQPVDVAAATPQCSTMPVSIEARGVMLPHSMASGSSCQSFARPHCTLPNHQGGLRLVGAVTAIRRPSPVGRPRGAAAAHHSFPIHLIQPNNYMLHHNHNHHQQHHQNQALMHAAAERDSANYSMASSGDSDNNMYISVNRA